MIFNQKGFTLTEILIGLAIMGGLGLVIFQVQENTLQTRNKSNHEQTINEASLIIQSALKDKATCSFSLKGKTAGEEVLNLTKAQINPNDFDDYISSGKILVEVNRPLPGDVMVQKMTFLQESNADYLAVDFNLDPQTRKKMVGGKTLRKLFPLKTLKTAGAIFSCYSETDDILGISEVEVCKDMRGTLSNGKCDFIDGVVDKTPTNCAPGSNYRLDGSTGVLRVVCSSCSLAKHFVRQSCEKKLPGVNWLNICYYQSVCVGTNTPFGLETWIVGGSSGKGGDTGSESNCYDKRDKCPGEL